MQYLLGKAVKKDAGSSQNSIEVKKPTGVKIKTKVEPLKQKVHSILIQIPFRLFPLNIYA
jgi:hypothetical protein